MSIEVKHHEPIVYKVYEELKQHIGVKNPISATDLCIICGVDGHRELRRIIREIRRSGELEKVIGSCKKGYYVCTNDDAQKSIDRLMNAAKNMFKTAYIMAKKVGLDGQMKIKMGDYFSDTYHSLMEIEDETNTETD